MKTISLFQSNYFRFNYQLLWSQQNQLVFTAFHNHFTADDCLPFIIIKQNEHPYFFKPETTNQAIGYISFDPRLITENNLHDDFIVMNKIYKNNKIHLSIITMMKMTIIMKNICLIKPKIMMKIWYSI